MLEPEPFEIPRRMSRNLVGFNSFQDVNNFWLEYLDRIPRNKNSNANSNKISRSTSFDPGVLLKASVDKLSLLVLDINNQDEDPADIFNALNGQRTEMAEFDHLRNFIFANIKDEDQRDHLYHNSWKIVERQVSKVKIKVKGSSALDTFLYDLLISLGEKRYQSISKDKTARQFAKYFNSSRNSLSAKVVADKMILPNLVSWASIKRNGLPLEIGRVNRELPDSTKSSLVIMDWMSSGPVVPLLLNVVNRFFSEEVSSSELETGINAIENYLARFIVSGDPLSPLRASIMNVCAKLGSRYSIEHLVDTIRELKHTDDDLTRRLLPSGSSKSDPYSPSGKIYENRTSRQLLAVFQGIEENLSGEHCSNLLSTNQNDALTIDHLYPQTPDRWKGDLKKWEVSPSYMQNRIHTLGNLAVIPKSINSEMSNKEFNKKKEILQNRRFAQLAINEDWQGKATNVWKPEDIDRRAARLLGNFLEKYPY